MTPTGFPSWKSFFSFTLARGFLDTERGSLIEPREVGRLESIGRTFSWAVQPVDLLLKNIRNPLVIISLTMTSLFVATIAFYPLQAWTAAVTVFPFLEKAATPHVLQAGCYFLTQATIAGLGIKAFGRLSNQDLLDRYLTGQVIAIPIGAIAY